MRARLPNLRGKFNILKGNKEPLNCFEFYVGFCCAKMIVLNVVKILNGESSPHNADLARLTEEKLIRHKGTS